MHERTRTLASVAACLACALSMAACSGGATGSTVTQVGASPSLAVTPAPTPSPTPEPTPTPTPSPTPEPTPDLAAIGAAYLAIADILTTRGQPAIDAIARGGSYTPEEWGAMHQAVADIYDEVIVKLDAIDFPDDLADEAEQMRAHWVDVREQFAEVAADPSIDNWDEFVETATAYGKVGDAIRAYLGLPPRPTPPPD